MWVTEIKEKITIPISKKAITLYAERVIKEKKLETVINDYKVEMLLNDSLVNNDLFKEMMIPEYAKNATDMINVMVCVPDDRWFVEIYYKIDGVWVREKND